MNFGKIIGLVLIVLLGILAVFSAYNHQGIRGYCASIMGLGNVNTVSSKDLMNSKEPVLFIDTRSLDAIKQSGRHHFAQNKKIDYVSIPFSATESNKFISKVFESLKKKKYSKLVLSCYKGVSAKVIAKILIKSDIDNVYVLLGGFDGDEGWVNSGLPIVKS